MTIGRLLLGSSATDGAEMVEAFEAYLLLTNPEPDPISREVTALVAEAERRNDIIRAEQLADLAGMSLRTYNGSSPSTSGSARSG